MVSNFVKVADDQAINLSNVCCIKRLDEESVLITFDGPKNSITVNAKSLEDNCGDILPKLAPPEKAEGKNTYKANFEV